MRKLNLTLLTLIGLIIFSSCDKGNLGPVVSDNPTAPSITKPAANESYTLTEGAAGDTLVKVEWTQPDFGFDAAANYVLEMDAQGNDFSDAFLIGSTNKTAFPLIVEELNNKLLANNFPGGQQSAVEIRITATVNDSLDKQVSDPVPLSVTPYKVQINYPEVYVPGGYQSSSGYTNDWSPADAPPLASANSDDVYEGYVYIDAANSEFKFTRERNWADGDWGDDGADGTLDPGGANIAASNAGYYLMTADLNNMTYSLLNTTWGVIGSATADDWNSDQDMTYDPANKVWTVTLDLTADEMKFRANDAWNLDYGDTGADGELDRGGDNIAISEAGNYTITLDLSNPPVYTYTLSKN